MQNPRLAGRYAKSLIDLAVEKQQLEQVYGDMLFLEALCKVSKDFVSLLRSPIIKAEKKEKIMEAVTNGKIGVLTTGFNRLLILKNREAVLPEIVQAFLEQYNALKGIHKVKLTTAVPVSDALKAAITEKVKKDTALSNVQLDTEVNMDLIGGFTLEFQDLLVDASIARDLQDIKKQFTQNIFVPSIQ